MKKMKWISFNVCLFFLSFLFISNYKSPVGSNKKEIVSQVDKNYDSLKIDSLQWIYYNDNNSILETKRTGGIGAICVDKKGTLWLGSGGPVYEIKDSKWITHQPEDKINDPIIFNISTIFYDSISNKLFLGSNYYGIGTYKSKSWKRLSRGNGNICRSISVDKKGNIIAKCGNELFCYEKKGKKSRLINEYFTEKTSVFNEGEAKKIFDHTYCNLTVDNNGVITTLCQNSIIRLVKGKWVATSLPNEFKHYEKCFSNISFNSKGDVWISVIGNGIKKLIKLSGDKYKIFDNKELPLYFDVIKNICVDNEGNAWFAFGYNGVAKFDGNKWITFTPQNSLLSDTYVETIYLDKREVVYIGTRSGVFIFKNGNRN